MQAKDIMTSNVIAVTSDSGVRDAAAVMLKHRISAVPVVDESGILVGIVSEGDLMHREEAGTRRRRSWWLWLFANAEALAEEFVKEHSHRVSDIMTHDVITASPETTLVEIAERLEKNGIKRVPIVENGKVVGIVSRANLVQALTMAPKQSAGSDALDSQIQQRILARLNSELWRPPWVNVRVEKGVVELWGTASSEAQRKAAHLAAELTPGVVGVKDGVKVQKPTYE